MRTRVIMKPTTRRLQDEIIQHVEESFEKLTPLSLARVVAKKYRIESYHARRFVKQLVTSGHLRYSDRYGRTVIEKSFERPVRISPHVILAPPGIDGGTRNGDLVVRLNPGVSFGDGQHPSSRLAVRAIDHLLKETALLPTRGETTLLDIGTGTGILAICALLCGIHTGIGIDTDPCARREAMGNAGQNGLVDRFRVRVLDIGDIEDRFDLILANLRWPTLARLLARMRALLRQPGAMILSGIKTDEVDPMIRNGAKQQLTCLWQAEEKGWCSLLFYKPSTGYTDR